MTVRSFAKAATLVLVTGSLLGCNSVTSPPPGTVKDLEFTAAISPGVIRVGEAATLELRLHNRGNGLVHLTFGDSCQILPYVATATGDVVYPGGGGWGCLTVITELRLEPGQTVVRTEQIQGGAPQTGIHTGAILAPGTYRLWGKLGEGPNPYAYSNNVALTVVE